MITGSTLAVAGIIVRRYNPDFPINGQVMWFIAMVASVTVYIFASGTLVAALCAVLTGLALASAGTIVQLTHPGFPLNAWVIWLVAIAGAIFVDVLVSLRDERGVFNMDRMLHRGKYTVVEDVAIGAREPVRGLNAILGMGREFTPGDKVIYVATIGWTGLWSAVFIFGTLYNVIAGVPARSWARYWQFFVVFSLVLGAATTLWFTIGGLRDIRNLFRALRTAKRDYRDDGMVIDHHDAGE